MGKADQGALEAIPGWRWTAGRRSPEDWVAVAEERARNHGGTLESYRWLMAHDFAALRFALTGRPDLFAHIRQDPAKKHTPSDWVLVAEDRARNHGGTLEPKAWLMANSFTGLCRALCRRPDLFAHIPQYCVDRHTPSAWVSLAEERARNHGGGLESQSWLKSNGLTGLRRALKHRPDLFMHIPCEMRNSHGCLVVIRGGGTKGAALARRLGVKHEA